MFKFEKNAPKNLPTSQSIDVQFNELPHQPIPPADTQKQFSTEQVVQALMHLVSTELALGKTEEEVISLLREKGATVDVALLIVKKATASVVVSDPSS